MSDKIKNPVIKKAIPSESNISFSFGADINGFACITLIEGNKKIRATFSNEQARQLANSLIGVSSSNGNDDKKIVQ